MTIDWHYPREALTKRVINAFDQGVAEALTLYAPPTMGKSEFVRFDLIPAAASRGYRPVYIDFSERPGDPASALLQALKQASTEPSMTGHLPDRRGSPLHGRDGLSRSAPWMNDSAIANQALKPDKETLDEIRRSFDVLVRQNDRILLCLDEVQHLANCSAFENLVFFLRTLLDEQRRTVQTFYTGSRKAGLRKLFKDRKAALFASSTQIDLPLLGDGFIAHIHTCFQQATSRTFDLGAGEQAFTLLNHIPGAFRLAIEAMVLDGERDVLRYAAQVNETLLDDSCFLERWERLKGVDKALLIWIASGHESLYHNSCRRYLEEQLGVSSVKTHTIQNALNRLRGWCLSAVSPGCYEFEDARFRDWVAEHCRS